MKKAAIKIFDQKQIRSLWREDEGKWYFSVQDVVEVLSESSDVKQYIKKMRSRDSELSSNWGTICTPLPMVAADGKIRRIQAADTEGLLRIIQSIPSPRAEPFKRWLAKVGSERIEETVDPEKAMERAMGTYARLGYSPEWINQRLKSIEIRKELTDEWDKGGVKKGLEYAILTDEITKAWAGLSTRNYKKLKALKNENLRDNMSNMELVLNMLAEATTTEISKSKKPKIFEEHKQVAREGGSIAGNTRNEIEQKTGEKIVTSKNTLKTGHQDNTKNLSG